MSYEGMWDSGKRHGFGILTTKDDEVHMCTFKEDLKHGVCTTYYSQNEKEKVKDSVQLYINN